eukprot:gnl/TRDRNA2_/TRDRNA2_162713_c0_seq1.p1 gnl/TRDRNA2_/TRDRNA2_162713_c0~~gnl/TRDRNA2_/TRDRNA2_162713_c0_seq1.p1  ORF type:complete len:575 (+),score=90.28 gnl/TRDRNA2_/TRDRNA2_162713_c0_seq1:115-1839(+)
MIFYDSHQWTSLLRVRGSIFPKAIIHSLPSALFALGLKYLQIHGYINTEGYEVLTHSGVFSGFTYVLGFSLVFRTSQSYSRYWTGATSVHQMSSEWSDACASIISFLQTTKKSQAEKHRFLHTIVRLFSLLHAMAMEEIASLVDENFPLMDIHAFRKEDLLLLAGDETHGNKVQIVLCWIKVCIVQAMDTGLVNAPAPIVTRVFQELGAGLVNYHNAQQVVIWPFPFPYTQMNLVLIYLYMFVTPLVICTWESHPVVCFCYTMFSVVCMTGLDLIASELENPFGDDPNDLPCLAMQHEMNRNLLVMLNPSAWKVPDLVASEVKEYKDMKAQRTEDLLSLQQYSAVGSDAKSRFEKMRTKWGRRKSRLPAQRSWATQQWPDNVTDKMRTWLDLSEGVWQGRRSQSPTQSLSTIHSAARESPGLPPEETKPLKESCQPEAKVEPLQDETIPLQKDALKDRFLEDLSGRLQDHLDQRIKQLGTLQERQMVALEQFLAEASKSLAAAVQQGQARSPRIGSPRHAAGIAGSPAHPVIMSFPKQAELVDRSEGGAVLNGCGTLFGASVAKVADPKRAFKS